MIGPCGGGGALTHPAVGKIRHVNPNKRMNKIPYTHGGTMNVVTERTVSPRSKAESAFRAIQRPSQIPNTAATMFATVNRTSVRGRRSKMIAPTSREPSEVWRLIARPSLNCNASIVYRNDFATNGSLSPRASIVAL